MKYFSHAAKHLSDAALMELLYGDHSESASPDAQNHLLNCETCRRRLDRYRSVSAALAGDPPAAAIPRKLAAHPTVTMDPVTLNPVTLDPVTLGNPPTLSRRPGVRHTSQRRWLTAAAVLFLAAAAGLVAVGFAAGARWQARLIDQAVARQWRTQEIAHRDLHEQLVQATSQWDQAIHSLTEQMASIQSSHDRLHATTLPTWEAVLARLIENQTRLRAELETLAVSAESEIARTQRDLRNLEVRRQLVFGPALE